MNSTRTEVPEVVLLAQDREHDVRLMKRAFAKAGIPKSLRVLTGAHTYIDYLQNANDSAVHDGQQQSKLLLLDFQTRRYEAFLVLDWIKRQTSGGPWRVVALVAPEEVLDLARACGTISGTVLAKPATFPQCTGLVRTIKTHWLRPPRTA